ncbi:MAG: DUF5996 family protein [Chloroflexota bacterium]
MSGYQFSSLPLSDWEATRDTIQVYAKVIGKIRRAQAPRQKHWWHVALTVGTTGLTTLPTAADGQTFEAVLDLVNHKIVITTSRGDQWHKPLHGQSAATFRDEALAALAAMDIHPDIDQSLFDDTTARTYDRDAAERYWQTMSQIDAIFRQFQGELRGETGPVLLWPHHIDLAMLWFSGRLIPGQDPDNEEYSDEQMNFGFSPGDESIPDPYFYITAYPTPDGLTDTPLPADAQWGSDGFSGAVMMYEALVGAEASDEKLLDFLRTVQRAGSSMMK